MEVAEFIASRRDEASSKAQGDGRRELEIFEGSLISCSYRPLIGL